MSFRIQNLIWEHYQGTSAELLMALAYATHAHDDGTNVRPSVAYVARRTRQSERSVQRYLTKMRKSGWLLTVRHGAGGRGRATEYRINPLWISNPDKLPPFTESTTERVTAQARKGDTGGRKRVTPLSPQPSLTLLEPTTTQKQIGDEPSQCEDELKWPAFFDEPTFASGKQILRNCPSPIRQQVLDEIAGLAERGAVRHPIGLLRKLVDRANEGLFVPAAALDFERKRTARAREEIARLEREQEQQRQPSADTQRVAQDHLAVIWNVLGGKSRSNRAKEPHNVQETKD